LTAVPHPPAILPPRAGRPLLSALIQVYRKPELKSINIIRDKYNNILIYANFIQTVQI